MSSRRSLDRPDKIPYIGRRGPYFYNFWTDAQHPRGLWRRTTPESFRLEQPAWEILLDIDALAAAEGEDWIWSGAATRPGTHDRAILRLSRGGSDAVVLREFDLASKAFVSDGYVLPEAKSARKLARSRHAAAEQCLGRRRHHVRLRPDGAAVAAGNRRSRDAGRLRSAAREHVGRRCRRSQRGDQDGLVPRTRSASSTSMSGWPMPPSTTGPSSTCRPTSRSMRIAAGSRSSRARRGPSAARPIPATRCWE